MSTDRSRCRSMIAKKPSPRTRTRHTWYRPNGPVVGNSKHHIRRLDQNLTKVKTIDATKLPECRAKTGSYLDSDNDHMVLHCGQVMYVRPAT